MVNVSFGKFALNVPEFLSNLPEKLIGTQCANQLFIDHRLDGQCARVLLRSGASLGIIGGSALVKLPQILKIFLNQSARGLSLPAVLLEMVASSITFAYNWRAGNAFMTFGETLFLTLQNALIVLLISIYGGSNASSHPHLSSSGLFKLLVIGVIYSLFLSSLFNPLYVPSERLKFLQTTTIPLVALCRLPQIMKIWSSGSSGQLSVISIFLTMAGSLVRLYTVLPTVSDTVIIAGHATSAALNTILFLQILFYSDKAVPSKSRKLRSKHD